MPNKYNTLKVWNVQKPIAPTQYATRSVDCVTDTISSSGDTATRNIVIKINKTLYTLAKIIPEQIDPIHRLANL